MDSEGTIFNESDVVVLEEKNLLGVLNDGCCIRSEVV